MYILFSHLKHTPTKRIYNVAFLSASTALCIFLLMLYLCWWCWATGGERPPGLTSSAFTSFLKSCLSHGAPFIFCTEKTYSVSVQVDFRGHFGSLLSTAPFADRVFQLTLYKLINNARALQCHIDFDPHKYLSNL